MVAKDRHVGALRWEAGVVGALSAYEISGCVAKLKCNFYPLPQSRDRQALAGGNFSIDKQSNPGLRFEMERK